MIFRAPDCARTDTAKGAERQERTRHPQDGVHKVGALCASRQPASAWSGRRQRRATVAAWPAMMATIGSIRNSA
jgi:hypothetical protein